MISNLPSTAASDRAPSHERLFNALLWRPECSRAELASLLGLSRQTVTVMVMEAEQAGLVEQRAQPGAVSVPLRGRPPLRVSLVPSGAFAIGLEFDHGRVRSAVCNIQGDVLSVHSAAADLDAPPSGNFDLACELTLAALEDSGAPLSHVIGAGVGLPAPVDARTGNVHARDFLPAWHGTRPADELRRRLRMPIRLMNNATAGAIGEHRFGAGRQASDVLYVRMSATISVGLILDARSYAGASGIAGEIGHSRVSAPGELCRCGNRGCLETVAGAIIVADEFGRSRREPSSLRQLIDAAVTGDRAAKRAIADAGDAVGRAIAGAINLLNPDRVIVGGDLAPAGDDLIKPLRAALVQEAVAPAAEVANLMVGELGELAEVLGAAATQLESAPAVLAGRLP